MLDQYAHGVRRNKEFVFDSPVTMFPWLAPEVLEQVSLLSLAIFLARMESEYDNLRIQRNLI